MEKRDDGVTEVEAGDEMLVVTANHMRGYAIVGTFTSYRLADIGAKAYASEYGKHDDGSLGEVVATHVYSTCLDQHGTCPLVTSPTVKLHDYGPRGPVVLDDVEVAGTVGPVTAAPHPGPYTKEILSEIPDYSLLVGPARVAESKAVVWDLFDLDGCSHGDVDEASRRVGLPVALREPEVDYEAARPHEDDLDAALSYLRAGGALCKVPDRPGSTCFRLMVVPFPGSPVRGNCA